MSDPPRTLSGRLKAELFSTATVVTLASVGVAVPGSYLAADLAGIQDAVFGLLLAAGVGPSMTFETAGRPRDDAASAATWGLAAAVWFLGAATAVAVAATTAGVAPENASAAGFAVTVLGGYLLARRRSG